MPGAAPATADKIYKNAGNHPVVDLVDADAVTVLDVGCGSGDNAALLRRRDPDKLIYGITASAGELAAARPYLDDCWLANLEVGLPEEVTGRSFDTLILSHVLEHLREPAQVLSELATLLVPGGSCVIAVPNVLHWRERLNFLRGRFEYQKTGILDATHLRFFTYHTARPLLFAGNEELWVEHVGVSGSAPLWVLRQRVFSPRQAARVDGWVCDRRPNLFGAQILIKARRRGGPGAGSEQEGRRGEGVPEPG